jgi:rubrerythrin
MAGAGPKDLHDIKKAEGLNREEVLRAIRLSIAAELDATNLYQMIAESSDDPLVKKVMTEVADEERVHAGEFLSLIRRLEPDEAKWHADGKSEVDDAVRKLGTGEKAPIATPPAPAVPPSDIPPEERFEDKKKEAGRNLLEQLDSDLDKVIKEENK